MLARPTSSRQAEHRRRPSIWSSPDARLYGETPSLCTFRINLLATLKLHYDGWLTLPAGLRDLLDLKTGDHLQAELVDGAIVLRPTHGKRAPAEPEPAAEMPVVARCRSGHYGSTGKAASRPTQEGAGRPEPGRAPAGPRGATGPTEAQAWPAAECPRRAAALDPVRSLESSGDEAVVCKLRPKASLPEANPDPCPIRRRPAAAACGGVARAGGAPAIPQCRGPQAGAGAAAQSAATDNRELANLAPKPSLATEAQPCSAFRCTCPQFAGQGQDVPGDVSGDGTRKPLPSHARA